MTWRRFSNAVAAVVLFGCAGAHAEPSAREMCATLRDHVVSLRLQAANGVDVEKHREALSQALGDEFVARCAELRIAQIQCALGASDTASVTSCTSPAAAREEGSR